MRACCFCVCLAVLCQMVRGEETPSGQFVGKFSNGVAVELIGVGMNPSSQAEWWKPNGTPLEGRPYANVRAHVGGATTRELCWRWHDIGDADVDTNWGTDPSYNGAGGHAADESGKRIKGLEASAIAFEGEHKECTVRFTITVPASDWQTTLDMQAGYASSISRMDPEIGQVQAAFLPSRGDGPDTVVILAYQIPKRETRLVGVDQEGREHIAERTAVSGISGTMLGEYRFKNVMRDNLKTWLIQTRIRRSETVEFHNVSLDPDQKTEVKVVDANDKTLDLSDANPAPSATNAANERYQQQQELVKALAEKHGYKLAEGELLKYVKDPQIEERDKFYSLLSDAMSVGEWMSQPNDSKPKFEPCMLLFQYQDGALSWQSSHNGITTLAEVVANVLKLGRHQIDCPPNLFLTYMPGDWVLSWNPNQPHPWSDAELTAFEKILNDEFNLSVRVGWKIEKRPTLVVSGKYKAAPAVVEELSADVAERAEGMFEIPTRRSDISARAGRPDEFIESIGEVLMLPVVNEAKTHPTKQGFFWRYTEDPPVVGHDRLAAELEQRVLDSLHEQLGYDFKIEPRDVRLLSIEPQETSK